MKITKSGKQLLGVRVRVDPLCKEFCPLLPPRNPINQFEATAVPPSLPPPSSFLVSNAPSPSLSAVFPHLLDNVNSFPCIKALPEEINPRENLEEKREKTLDMKSVMEARGI